MYNKRGATLIEVMLTVVLLAIVTMGLVIAYLFGIDAWDRTAKKTVLNESGSFVMFSVTRDIQRADSLEILNSGKDLFLRIRPYSQEVLPHTITYKLLDNRLDRDSNGVVTPIIPQYKNDSISINMIEGTKLFTLHKGLPTNEFDRIVDLQFSLTLKNAKVEEETEFKTTIFARNLSL